MEGRLYDRIHWAEVWMRFRFGDREAFREIYEEFIDVLFDYGTKITDDRELIKDSIHDLFYDLHRYSPKLHHPEYLEFYLFRSLKNLLIRKIKKSNTESPLTEEGLSRFDLKYNAELDIFDKESNYLRSEALKQILQTLDSGKRELLFLKFSTGLNYVEIGHLLNMKPDTVKKQIYRILDQLRSKFSKRLIEMLLICIKDRRF